MPVKPDQSLQRSYIGKPSSEYFDHTEKIEVTKLICYNTPKMSETSFMLMAIALKYFRNCNEIFISCYVSDGLRHGKTFFGASDQAGHEPVFSTIHNPVHSSLVKILFDSQNYGCRNEKKQHAAAKNRC